MNGGEIMGGDIFSTAAMMPYALGAQGAPRFQDLRFELRGDKIKAKLTEKIAAVSKIDREAEEIQKTYLKDKEAYEVAHKQWWISLSAEPDPTRRTEIREKGPVPPTPPVIIRDTSERPRLECLLRLIDDDDIVDLDLEEALYLGF